MLYFGFAASCLIALDWKELKLLMMIRTRLKQLFRHFYFIIVVTMAVVKLGHGENPKRWYWAYGDPYVILDYTRYFGPPEFFLVIAWYYKHVSIYSWQCYILHMGNFIRVYYVKIKTFHFTIFLLENFISNYLDKNLTNYYETRKKLSQQ